MATQVPTLEEVLALPYGDDAQTLTDVSDINALEYTGGPSFSKGMTAASRRDYHRAYGERVGWLRAVEGSLGPNGETPRSNNGKVYVDQLLSYDVRVLLYQNRRSVSEQEFGDIAEGQFMLSFLPDEIQPIRDDRFVAWDRVFHTREVLRQSDETSRQLDHQFVAAIEAIYGNGERLLPSSYSLSGGGVIEWYGAAPEADVTVVYSYHPVFEWLEDGSKQGPMGSDGLRLPTTGPLKLLSAGEE